MRVSSKQPVFHLSSGLQAYKKNYRQSPRITTHFLHFVGKKIILLSSVLRFISCKIMSGLAQMISGSCSMWDYSNNATLENWHIDS